MPASNKKKVDTAAALKAAEEKAATAAKELKATAENTTAAAKTAVKETKVKAEKAVKATKAKAAKAVKETKAKAEKAVSAAKEKAAEVNATVYVEYQGRQVCLNDMVSAVMHDWGASGQKPAALKDLKLYIKPEDSAVYYVANGDTVHGKVNF